MELKPCYGFILRFGFAESGHASPLIIHIASGPGFDTVEEGARSLAKFFLDEYLRSVSSNIKYVSKYEKYVTCGCTKQVTCEKHIPNLENFQNYIADSGLAVSDNWVDGGEDWWPWDTIKELYPVLTSFWESWDGDCSGSEVYLPRFLNIEEDVPEEWLQLREDLRHDREENEKWLKSLGIKEKPAFVKVVS